MKQYSYDLHIHSCLSPCSDALMTPPNIVNMAHSNGLDIIAITDHNSTRNVGAVMRAAKGLPLTVIPGIEVTTAEEIDVVCLFPDLDSAEKAGRELEKHLPQIPNHSGHFGKQIVIDETETVTDVFPNLLLNALDISIDDLPKFIESHGGICYPAHIDKPTHSILSVFGCLPDTLGFSALEVRNREKFFSSEINDHFRQKHVIITSSGAHKLSDISEKKNFIDLAEPTFGALKEALLSNRKPSSC